MKRLILALAILMLAPSAVTANDGELSSAAISIGIEVGRLQARSDPKLIDGTVQWVAAPDFGGVIYKRTTGSKSWACTVGVWYDHSDRAWKYSGLVFNGDPVTIESYCTRI